MLLKFTAADMLNTSLIDVATGDKAYDIVTVITAPTDIPESFSSPSNAFASSSKSPSPIQQHKEPSTPEDATRCERRRTKIRDAVGNIVADITWNGRRPDITIGDEKVGPLTDLFGSSTVRFLPKILAIPTRFDTEYIWTATADSLTLFDYDTETIRGTFHQNSIRIPRPSASKFKLISPSKFNLSSPSTQFLTSTSLSSSSSSSSSSSIKQRDFDNKPLKSSFIPTRLPGVGSNYLEFTPHPLAQDIEIIVSFLMMEILRRGRFNLTPYTFQKPKLWQLKAARDLVLRPLRRNTV
ncbi:hypothetical protein BYT27DRAFT_7241401 [Phlegmacium glaucopus]|nr:hypothetical protein BYT27DRAFT_7241401 [Phlegmacium glaucopus]